MMGDLVWWVGGIGLLFVLPVGLTIAMYLNEQKHYRRGDRHCSTCGKWRPKGVSCDYGWDGQCTFGDYDFKRDSLGVRGRGQL